MSVYLEGAPYKYSVTLHYIHTRIHTIHTSLECGWSGWRFKDCCSDWDRRYL